MLTTMLTGWATATLGLWVASRVLSGVHLASFADAVWGGALLGLLHWVFTKPIFVLLGIGTLGLGFLFFFITRWIASAIVVLLASHLSSRFEVTGFWAALATAFITAAMGEVVRWLT